MENTLEVDYEIAGRGNRIVQVVPGWLCCLLTTEMWFWRGKRSMGEETLRHAVMGKDRKERDKESDEVSSIDLILS